MAGYTDIRDAFTQWAIEHGYQPATLDAGGEAVAPAEALEALKGSEDTRPAATCEGLGMRRSSTFGEALEAAHEEGSVLYSGRDFGITEDDVDEPIREAYEIAEMLGALLEAEPLKEREGGK